MYRAERNVLPLFIGYQEEPMELVACLRRTAATNDRWRLVTTEAAAGSTLSEMDPARLAGVPSGVNTMLMNGMDACAPPGLVAALVPIVPDASVVAFA
jgi:hypothetical protein